MRVIEGFRRRMAVDVRLENKGENAYSTRLNITYTFNLHFSSLIVKVRSLRTQLSRWRESNKTHCVLKLRMINNSKKE